jgi:hypothetical protein
MRSIRRMAVALAACAVVVGVVGTGSAQALTVKPCIGSGQLRTAPSGDPAHPIAWFIQGRGSCPAQLQLLLNPREPQQVSFIGGGTSDTLGLCDGSVLVRKLFLTVRVSYTNTVTGVTTTETQYWRAPVTTFPLVTPFFQFAQPVGGPIQGVGLVLHHVALNCGNAGTMPAASFGWVERRNP